MFRLVASNPSFGADSHTPDVGGRFGPLRTGLWKQRAGWPAGLLLHQLQSVLNAAARLVYHLRARNHITDALISLHWLRAPERILYKMAVLTYKALHGGSPRSVRWSMSLACLVDQHSALPDRTVCGLRRSNYQRSAVERSGRSSTVLEQAARQCHVSQFIVGFPTATETHAVPAVIPRHYHVTFLNSNTYSGPSSGIAT